MLYKSSAAGHGPEKEGFLPHHGLGAGVRPSDRPDPGGRDLTTGQKTRM